MVHDCRVETVATVRVRVLFVSIVQAVVDNTCVDVATVRHSIGTIFVFSGDDKQEVRFLTFEIPSSLKRPSRRHWPSNHPRRIRSVRILVGDCASDITGTEYGAGDVPPDVRHEVSPSWPGTVGDGLQVDHGKATLRGTQQLRVRQYPRWWPLFAPTFAVKKRDSV